MTERQLKICRAILEVLNLMDGAQLDETILHAEVNLRLKPNASLSEFRDGLDVCDRSGWVIGITSKFGRKLWNLSDAGQAARLEMKQ